MSLWFLLPTLALAAPVETYPYVADVDVPAEGIVRIDVPLELRAPDDVRDGSDLLLVDATGAAIPFAVIDGYPSVTRVAGHRGFSPREAISYQVDRDSDGSSYGIRVTGQPLDGLSVGLRNVPSAADLTLWRIDEDGRETVVGKKRIFRLVHQDDTDMNAVLDPGAYRLDIDMLQRTAFEVRGIDGFRLSSPVLPDEERTVVFSPPELQENGLALYDLGLVQAMPIEWVTLHPTPNLLNRQASIEPYVRRDELPASLAPEVSLLNPQPIQRLVLGRANLSSTTLRVPSGPRVDRYTVAIDGQPFELPSATVGARGLAIVAQDVGPGPLTLYGGHVGDLLGNDLQFALSELVRNTTVVTRADGVRDNPSYQPPPLPSPAVGPPLDDKGLTYGRTLEGNGLVRIPLDDHVLKHARSDLGDLRLRTVDGRQVAYALRRTDELGMANDLPMARVERGAESRIEVTLPQTNLPLRHVTLHTSEPTFNRTVTIWRTRGKRTEVLRSVQWSSSSHPGVLSVGIGQRVGETFAITIDNGDDPPLGIDAVDATWSRWELVAALPERAVELRYGDDERYAPSYDAAAALVRVRSAPLATVGPPEKRTYTAPLLERGATFGGLVCVAVGLIVLLGLLIAGAKDPEAADPDDDDDVDVDDGDDSSAPRSATGEVASPDDGDGASKAEADTPNAAPVAPDAKEPV